MKKLLFGAVALAVLAAPAFAQKMMGGGKDSEPLEILDREKKQQAEQLDQQYNRQMERSRKDSNTAARTDPWSNMRAPAEGKR